MCAENYRNNKTPLLKIHPSLVPTTMTKTKMIQKTTPVTKITRRVNLLNHHNKKQRREQKQSEKPRNVRRRNNWKE
jgi:hypothetical protein